MNEATQTVPCTRKEIKLTPRQEVNFWKKVNKDGPTMPHMETPCWVWTAGKNRGGYGKFNVGRKTLIAPRIAWTLANGQIPDDGSYHGICACHRCDNPPCVNPAHLFLGTMGDDTRDKVAKGRCNSPRGDDHHSRRHPERMPRGDNHPARLRPERLARGDGHCNAKLTAAKVVAIRAAFAAGGITQRKLAEQFGVCRPVLSGIINRKSWKHV
jgi:hypothetical protein